MAFKPLPSAPSGRALTQNAEQEILPSYWHLYLSRGTLPSICLAPCRTLSVKPRRVTRDATRGDKLPRWNTDHCVCSGYWLLRQRPTWVVIPRKTLGESTLCRAPERGRRPGYVLVCPWPGVWERPCVRRSHFFVPDMNIPSHTLAFGPRCGCPSGREPFDRFVLAFFRQATLDSRQASSIISVRYVGSVAMECCPP